MPKATATQLRDEGWRVDQFGGALTPTEFTSYLTAVLSEAGAWAEHHIGSAAYSALPGAGYVFNLVARAELCYSASILWRRRAAFFDAGIQQDLQSPAYTERREYLGHADQMMDCAHSALADALRAIGLPTDGLGADWSGMAVGSVETGPYPLAREVPA